MMRTNTHKLAFVFFSPVLAAGIFNHRAGNDLGSIFCSDSSQLPHATVAQTALHHLLLSVWIRNYSHHPLGLAQRRHWRIYCTGKRKKDRNKIPRCFSFAIFLQCSYTSGNEGEAALIKFSLSRELFSTIQMQTLWHLLRSSKQVE